MDSSSSSSLRLMIETIKVPPVTRETVNKVAEEIVVILKNHHLVLNPRSSLIEIFTLLQGNLAKRTAVVYLILLLNKIGHTFYPANREENYQEEFENAILTILFYFDHLDEDVHNDIQQIIFRWLSTQIVDNPNLPNPQREFFGMVVKRGAGYLGLYRAICLQVCEVGLQNRYGFSCPMEGFMFNQSIWNDRVEMVISISKNILSTISCGATTTPRFSDFFAIASWKPGMNDRKLSMKIILTEAIVGKDSWMDPLPDPVFPNATTTEEIYCCDYSEEEKEKGRKRFFETMKRVEKEQIFLLADKNASVLFPDQSELKNRLRKPPYSLKVLGTYFDGDLIIFINHLSGSIVAFHSPLSIAGDSQQFITNRQRVSRGLLSAVLSEVVAKLKGVSSNEIPSTWAPGLPTSSSYSSPLSTPFPIANQTTKILFGIFAFELTTDGFHQQRRLGSAMFRDAITADEINALSLSDLSGSHHIGETEFSYPWARNLQEKLRQLYSEDNAKDPNSTRTVDKDIVWKAFIIFSEEYDPTASLSPASLVIPSSSRSPLGLSLEEEYPEAFQKMSETIEKVDAVFSRMNGKEDESDIVRVQCWRWGQLFKKFEKIKDFEDNQDPLILRHKEEAANFVSFLKYVRNSRKQRNGNPNATGRTTSQQETYRESREQCLKRVLETPRLQFFIRENLQQKEIHEGSHEGIPVVNYTTVSGLRGSLSMREREKRKRSGTPSVHDFMNQLYSVKTSSEDLPTKWIVSKVQKKNSRRGNGIFYKGYVLMRLEPSFDHYQPAPTMSPLGFPSSPQQQYQLCQQQQQQQLQQQLHSPFQQLPQEHPSPMSITSSSSVMQNLSSCGSPTPGEITSPLQGMRSPTGSPFDPTHNHYSQGSSSGMGGGSSNSPFGNPTFSMQTQGYGGGTGGGSGFGPPRGFPSSKNARDVDRRASTMEETHHAHIPMSGVSEKGMGHEEPKKKGRHCWECGVSKTPSWRRGPDNQWLCNSCGLKYIRKKKKERERKAQNTSSPSPMNFE